MSKEAFLDSPNTAELEKIYLNKTIDTTESLGAEYKARFTGAFGDRGCFSFNGNKIISTGGGGMVVSNDRKRLAHIKFLSHL